MSHNIIGSETGLHDRHPVLGGNHMGWMPSRNRVWIHLLQGAAAAVFVLGAIGVMASLR